MTDTADGRVDGCRVTLGHEAALSRRETVDPTQAIVIEFNRARQETLWAEALVRHDAMHNKNLSYGVSTPNRQFVGALGEASVLVWLYETLPAHFVLSDDRPGGADAYVRNPQDDQGWTLIEVKTHRSGFWAANGRLVNAHQLPRMSADVLVWCVAPPPIGEQVVIAGWCPVAEARATGVPEITGPKSNVRVDSALRTPQKLTDWLGSGRRVPLDDAPQ